MQHLNHSPESMQRMRSADCLAVIAIGPFGHAVARHLMATRTDIMPLTREAGRVVDPAEARTTVLASSWPVPDICEQLDKRSHETNRPFVPLIVSDLKLALGPIVVPGRGACWRCWTVRLMQHTCHIPEHLALTKYYDSEATRTSNSPNGYLAPYALLAACRVSEELTCLETNQEYRGGAVWQLDMVTRSVRSAQVVGVHGCSRCGLSRSERERSVHELKHSLAYIWQEI